MSFPRHFTSYKHDPEQESFDPGMGFACSTDDVSIAPL